MKSIYVLLSALVLTSCAASAPVVIKYTNPTFNAISNSCAPDTSRCTDLKEAKLFGQMFGRVDSVLFDTNTARIAMPDSFRFAAQETLWTFWGIWYDSTGNPSCKLAIQHRVKTNPLAGTFQP
jgi:hypothetical protein